MGIMYSIDTDTERFEGRDLEAMNELAIEISNKYGQCSIQSKTDNGEVAVVDVYVRGKKIPLGNNSEEVK